MPDGIIMSDKEKIRRLLDKKGNKFYFMGIGGISMSTLAEICIDKGQRVFGSDVRESEITRFLEKRCERIFYSQCSQNVNEILPDAAVYSFAIKEDSEELAAARRLGIPTVSRAELLSVISEEYGCVIAVSGSHGKSTAVAMAASAFRALGCSPDVLCGAAVNGSSGYIKGSGELAVAEACEYCNSFLKLNPDYRIFLNLDLDHTDTFPSLDSIKRAFAEAARRTKREIVVNADDGNLLSVLPEFSDKAVTVSSRLGYDYRYEIKGNAFDFYRGNKFLGSFSLSVAGAFNVSNAATVLALVDRMGKDTALGGKGLFEFSGIPRRLEKLGSYLGTDVFYDYAHHPKEIAATRDALFGMGYSTVGVIFAPHTYSRTAAFFPDFARELSGFHRVLLTEIWGAREKNTGSVSSEALAERIRELGTSASVAQPRQMLKYIKEESPDCFVLMGAGDLEEYKRIIEENK